MNRKKQTIRGFAILQVKNCTVEIVDDNVYEKSEKFYVWLTQPLTTGISHGALTELNSSTVLITNNDDSKCMYRSKCDRILKQELISEN